MLISEDQVLGFEETFAFAIVSPFFKLPPLYRFCLFRDERETELQNSLKLAFQGFEQQNGDLAESAKDRQQERWVLVYIYIILCTQCHKYCIFVGKCAGTLDEKATRKQN